MPNGKGYLITFDGVASTTIPEFICHRVHRSLVGQNRSILREISGRDGAWYFPEKRGLRKVTVEASIVAGGFPTPRRDALVAVANWIDKNGFKKLIIGDQPDRYYRAVLATEADIEEWRERGTFDLEFLAEPYAYGNAISSESLTLTVGGFEGIFSMPDEVDAYPVIEITPNGSDVTDLVFNVNGYELTIAGPILSGTTYTINSIAYIGVEGPNTDTDIVGEFDPMSVAMNGVSGQFPVLIEGSNDQLVIISSIGTGSPTNFTVDVQWRRRYR